MNEFNYNTGIPKNEVDIMVMCDHIEGLNFKGKTDIEIFKQDYQDKVDFSKYEVKEHKIIFYSLEKKK